MSEIIMGLLPLVLLFGTGLFILVLDILSPRSRWVNIYVGLLGYVIGFLSIRWTRINVEIPGFYVDRFALLGTALVMLCGFLVLLFSLEYFEGSDQSPTEWTFLLLSASIGLCMMFSTRHLLVLFVGLEMSSLAFYVLCGYRRTERASMESSLKYFILGSVGSAFLLLGMALVFVNQQTLFINEFRFASGPGQIGFLASTMVVILGLAFKLSLIPLHVWVPDVYEGAPTPITAFMSVAVKIAVLGFLVRFFAQAVGEINFHWGQIFWWLAAITIIFGNVLALVQNKIKRMLAYSSISHAGYLTLGIVAANQMGFAAIEFYLLVYTFMNLGAFGLVQLAEGNESDLRYADLRGMSLSNPYLAASIGVIMVSLAGLPPTGGFMGKFLLFNGVAQAGYPGLAVIAVIGSLISVAYYFRVLVNCYMVDPPEGNNGFSLQSSFKGRALTVMMSLVVLYLGILPSTVLEGFYRIVGQLAA